VGPKLKRTEKNPANYSAGIEESSDEQRKDYGRRTRAGRIVGRKRLPMTYVEDEKKRQEVTVPK
jgi:hypothetical protein